MARRDCRLFLRCLGATLALLLLTSGIAVFAVRSASSEGSYVPLKIAVVDGEDTVASRILVHTVRNTDYVSGLFETETMREDEAMAAFFAGGVAAVIVLPGDFVSAVVSGSPARGRILVSSAFAGQEELIRTAARAGELLLLSGQAGVFAGERILDGQHAASSVRDTYLNRVNAALLEEAIAAGQRYFTVETTGYADTGMDEVAYLVLVWLTAVLMLTGVFLTPLFTADCRPELLGRLRSLGVGWGRFLLPKLVYTLIFRLAVFFAALILLDRFGVIRAEMSGFGAALFGMACMTVVCAALSLCFGGGMVSTALAAMTGLFALGGIVPRAALPGWVRTLGQWTPSGAAQAFFAPAFGGTKPTLSAVFCALGWTLAALLLLRAHLDRVTRGGGRV